jgi:hypothetical protein
MRTRLLTAVLTAVVACGCSGSSAQRPAPSSPSPLENRAAAAPQPARGSDEDEVRLAVYRYLVDHNASGAQTGAPFVCLEINENDQARDPSPFIITAMSKRRPRAVPVSACESSTEGVFLKGDRAKGRGLVFRTEDVKIDGDKATVTGGYFEAGLSASGNIYTLERHQGCALEGRPRLLDLRGPPDQQGDHRARRRPAHRQGHRRALPRPPADQPARRPERAGVPFIGAASTAQDESHRVLGDADRQLRDCRCRRLPGHAWLDLHIRAAHARRRRLHRTRCPQDLGLAGSLTLARPPARVVAEGDRSSRRWVDPDRG